MTVLIKEVCNTCSKGISIGQAIVECSQCNCVMHHKCYRSSNTNIDGNFLCNSCVITATKRYNPFKYDLRDDEIDLDDSNTKLACILDKCAQYDTKTINESMKSLVAGQMSILFQNIDGNQSNFDTMCIDLHRYQHKFSVIALAETNAGPEMSSLYQLSEYNSFYQSTLSNKRKGTGVAMYTHQSISATVDTELSHVSQNLETLFLKFATGNSHTVVGVLYRPPSGNLDEALNELAEILDNAPKNTFISGAVSYTHLTLPTIYSE